MIISIAISYTNGNLWSCAEDFETAEEGLLYAKARSIGKMGKIMNVCVAPLRATGLEMAAEIKRLIRQC